MPRVNNQSSGPSYSVSRLCQSLHDIGQDVDLHVLEPVPNEQPDYQLHAHPSSKFPGAVRLGWSPAMKRELDQAAKQANVVHNHSMWMMPNIYSYRSARKAERKFVFSPRGTLSGWAMKRSYMRKRLVWWYGQKAAIFGADCLHATSEKELDEIRANGLKQPVAVIPNGIDVPVFIKPRLRTGHTRILLFLSRLHPVKRVDVLLQRWKHLQTKFPDWELVIAGPLKGDYPQKMLKLSAELGLERVTFTDEVLGAEKSNLLAAAELFVLPTNTENFGVSIAEALAHATPVIVTKGTPWAGVETRACGWWIDHGEESLQAALDRAMNLSGAQLEAMGQRGRAWMEQDYAWNHIGEKMLETYNWLQYNGNKPDWVEICKQ